MKLQILAKLKDPRTNWKHILIVVILAFIVGGGIWVIGYWWLPQMEAPPTQFPEVRKQAKIEEPKEEKELDEDQIANWMIYENDEHGYEIRYPKDYLVKEEKIIHGLEEEQPPEYVSRYRYDKPVWLLHALEIYHPLPGEGKIRINIWNNANNFTIDQWLDYVNAGVTQGLLYEGRFVSNRERISFKGIEAIKGQYGCCGACIEGIFIPKEDKIHNLQLDGFLSDDECSYGEGIKDVYTQILSTFRFLR